MSKELEALYYFLGSYKEFLKGKDTYCQITLTREQATEFIKEVDEVKQALQRLEAIDNAITSDPIKYDEKANEENMKLFKKWGFGNSDEIYKCVLCGCQTCLSDSTSVMGYKLICNTCAYTTFAGHYGDARNWQRHCSVKLALNSLYGECRGDDNK